MTVAGRRRALTGAVLLDLAALADRIGEHTERLDGRDTRWSTHRVQRRRQLVESAIGKAVQRDIDQGFANEDSAQFEPDDLNDDMSLGDD